MQIPKADVQVVVEIRNRLQIGMTKRKLDKRVVEEAIGPLVIPFCQLQSPGTQTFITLNEAVGMGSGGF